MSTYLGFDVLELDYNRLGAVEETLSRNFVVLDNTTGLRTADEIGESPAGVRPFTWSAFSRAEITALRTFVDARKGIAVPFWLPSYQWDLSLSEDLLTAAAVVSVDWVRYTQQMFGEDGARRHIALWTHGVSGAMAYYGIEDADDPGNGATESLTISPVAVRDYDAETTVVSFLKLCRLESDQVAISYPDTTHAEATILVRELPRETPVPGE